jgi:hypothetical protein
LVIDGLLTAGFGVQHSVLATLRVKALASSWWRIKAIEWRTVESLVNVAYILVAAALWQDSGVVVWSAGGPLRVVLWVVLLASWLWYWQLHLFEYDAGLAFGSTTLINRIERRVPPALIPWKVGSRRWIRFPVHTALFGMLLALRTMSAELLVVGIVANVYNVIGWVLYDLRLLRLAQDKYRRYMEVTGLIWPPVYRAPRGAADLVMAAPAHWSRPVRHLPGVLLGVAAGFCYWAFLGHVVHAPVDMAKVAVAGVVVAAVGGLALGVIDQLGLFGRPAADWDDRQTQLSTTDAVMAAVGVVTWVGLNLVHTGAVPGVGTLLPLWFTVQYLGHVAAYFGTRLVGAGSPRHRAAPASELATQGVK